MKQCRCDGCVEERLGAGITWNGMPLWQAIQTGAIYECGTVAYGTTIANSTVNTSVSIPLRNWTSTWSEP